MTPELIEAIFYCADCQFIRTYKTREAGLRQYDIHNRRRHGHRTLYINNQLQTHSTTPTTMLDLPLTDTPNTTGDPEPCPPPTSSRPTSYPPLRALN